MKTPCSTRQTRASLFKAEGARKEDSTRCNVPKAKTTHTQEVKKGNKSTRENGHVVKATYYAPFLKQAAMVYRDGRANSQKPSRVRLMWKPYSKFHCSIK